MTAAPRISWAARSRALPGELVCGDRSLVRTRAQDVVVAAVDGLGHGMGAAEAASLAVEVLGQSEASELSTLIEQVHRGVARTRGVALTAAQLRGDGAVTWAGVGNVSCVSIAPDGQRVWLRSQNGILGHRLVRLEPQRMTVASGTTLVFATDGIEESFAESVRPLPVQEVADGLLASHARAADDALVLVVRYEGSSP